MSPASPGRLAVTARGSAGRPGPQRDASPRGLSVAAAGGGHLDRPVGLPAQQAPQWAQPDDSACLQSCNLRASPFARGLSRRVSNPVAQLLT